MGAVSKRARKIREASEFDTSRLKAELLKPKDSRLASFSWSLEQIFAARDQQMLGHFFLPAQMAASMRTDDALYPAYENRLAPQRCIQVEITPAKGARAVSIAGEAEALFGQKGVGIHPDTLADVGGCLVDHGVAIGINVYTPRPDGSRVDVEMKYWPIEYVQWDPVLRILKARVDPESIPPNEIPKDILEETYGFVGGGYLPIIHGDGRWVVFTKHEIDPWKKEAAILPASTVWARHAFAIRDWAKGSVAHGNAKVVGEMPAGVALQEADGALTPEAAAFLVLLQAIASGDTPAGIRPAGSKTDFLTNNSTAWQVWSELVANAEKAAARIYLGTDGTLGTQGGAPGVDISALFGVATTKVSGDLKCLERGILTGVIEPWCAINFGDSSLAPSRDYLIPDAEDDAQKASVAKRNTSFFAVLQSAHDAGIVLPVEYINQLAEDFGVRAPNLVTPPTLTPPAAAGTPSPKPAPPGGSRETASVFLGDQPRASDGKFGSGGGHSKPKPNPETPDVSKMPLLGEGANRKVYDAGDDTVIKVAKDAKARKDNRTEAEASGKDPLLADITEHGDKYSWVKQEKLDPVSNDDLAKAFGVSAADAKRKYDVVIKDPFGIDQKVTGKDWLFAATHTANGTNASGSYLGGDKVKSAGKFEEALKRLKTNVPKLDVTDLAFSAQWGMSKSGKVKVADYGFTG